MEISNQSPEAYVRKNKISLLNFFVHNKSPQSVENPTSIFMAGATGAGKTETVNSLMKVFDSYVRIDADEVRKWLPGYNGANAQKYQHAASLGVERIHDYCLKNKFNFILDGTLQNYDKAKSNIERALKRGRKVMIIFVYQEPKISWQLVKKRESIDGRKVTLEVFKQSYVNSVENVSKLKIEYSDAINLICFEKQGDPLSPNFKQKVHVDVKSISACLKVDKLYDGDYDIV